MKQQMRRGFRYGMKCLTYGSCISFRLMILQLAVDGKDLGSCPKVSFGSPISGVQSLGFGTKRSIN